MSQLLIQQYLNQLSTLKKVSGSTRESVVREAFKDLLKGWARSHDLVFVPEYEIETKTKERRYVDGALLYELRVPFGYWEAKDEKDDLEAEIEHKFKRGYPQDNIIFEDSKFAILIQNRQEVIRCFVDDTKGLEKLLSLFFRYERAEVSEFRHAVEQFKADLPAVLKALREMIEREHTANAKFRAAEKKFLAHAQEAINPSLTDADVREMLIQHVLTEEIFSKVFGEDDFHRQNNVAKELYALEATFFTGDLKKRTLRGLDAYYAAIRSAAAQIGSHHEKQAFLKVIYENFYKVYNKKAADRLGVVYTPNEIVRFMIESADWLCEKHFGRNLIDKDVEILDPATGTGTFICELLEHFRGQPAKLKHKYAKELHANEVAILPYYVANLNIEATYAAITGEYAEFENLCFVDTLDNTEGLRKHVGHVDDMFGTMSAENVARIRRQNIKRISVVIGNPPYNANQLNENENNKNREYPEIDKRIKNTYIAASTAQKTKLYDMYARFFRWASDRLDANGVLAFISNRSFIDSRTFDGFRDVVSKEFNEIRIVDLGGDVRINPKLSGTKHNVFGIQTGVAISFMVKRAKTKGCRIYYTRRPEMETADEKLTFLSGAKLSALSSEEIEPDEKHNWINLSETDFESLLPIAAKESKFAKTAAKEKTIFKMFSLGVITARDEWVYDDDRKNLETKVQWLIEAYNADLSKLTNMRKSANLAEMLDTKIKWTRAVKNDLRRGTRYAFDADHVIETQYRPFRKAHLYFDKRLNEMQYQLGALFTGVPNKTITFLSVFSSNPLAAMAVQQPFDYCLLKMGNGGTQALSFWYYDDGHRKENITNWALDQFKKQYQPGKAKKSRTIDKESIFHYVYGVLHDPLYREKYAQNLKREFPRIPFYADFWQWTDWGKALMDLHIGYEGVAPAKLKRVDVSDEKAKKAGQTPKAMLKADKDGGRIVVDSETTLAGIPPEAWDYKLGNRSGLEWILDQYKESKPKDPTIREKFDTYRFADYKEKVIDLLARVTTVSIDTQRIVEAMKKASR
jgi:predicted helicase